MRKLVTVMIATTVNIEADTNDIARDKTMNDPTVKAMVYERLSQEGYEITDIQDADEGD